MKRREFITLLGGAAAWPLPARAQQHGRVHRIGLLEMTPASSNAANFDALRKGLRELGYVEGQNLIFDYRSVDGRPERFPQLAAELVRLNVDLIVTRGTPAVMAAKNATGTIPVVMAASGEPVGTGIVAGLARPGGNITGLSAFTSELFLKRLELLREMVAGIRRIALMHNMENPLVPPQWEEFKTVAPSLGLEAQLLDVRKSEDIVRGIPRRKCPAHRRNPRGERRRQLANRREVVELAAKHRMPMMYNSREFIDAGGLMSYGVNYADLYRRAAIFVNKIFKGSKPGDLPVEQPTKFELVDQSQDRQGARP